MVNDFINFLNGCIREKKNEEKEERQEEKDHEEKKSCFSCSGI
jgi:hypothetical protein